MPWAISIFTAASPRTVSGTVGFFLRSLELSLSELELSEELSSELESLSSLAESSPELAELNLAAEGVLVTAALR